MVPWLLFDTLFRRTCFRLNDHRNIFSTGKKIGHTVLFCATTQNEVIVSSEESLYPIMPVYLQDGLFISKISGENCRGNRG
jgi:hypothetical protein